MSAERLLRIERSRPKSASQRTTGMGVGGCNDLKHKVFRRSRLPSEKHVSRAAAIHCFYYCLMDLTYPRPYGRPAVRAAAVGSKPVSITAGDTRAPGRAMNYEGV